MVSYLELFDNVFNENQALNTSIQYMSDTASSDDRRIMYGNEQLSWYQSINNVLFALYCFFFLVLLILLFYNKYLPYMKVLIVLFFFCFPLLITSIEIILYNIFIYFYTFIFVRTYPGNAFNK